MANKRSSHKRRSHPKSKTMKQRGGDLGGNPPSAWGYMLGTVGNGPQQFYDTFIKSTTQSNVIVPLGGASSSQPNLTGSNLTGSNLTGSNLTGSNLTGGKRRRLKNKSKRGGNLGAVLAQAAVPGTLFLLNQSAKRRRHRR